MRNAAIALICKIIARTCERVVQRSELVKGYQFEKDRYVTIDEDDLKTVRPESSSNMEILQFINIDEVDPIYFERTYYLGPDRNSEKTFGLLAKAMEETQRAAIGKLVMRNHEYLASGSTRNERIDFAFDVVRR